MTTVTDPLEDATTYAHDADGQVSKVTDPLGHNRSRTYDANRNLATATDGMGTGGSDGNVTAYGWDARNNPTSAKLPTGATSSLTGYQTIAGADLPGTMKMPDGEESKYSYDAKGNTTSVAVSGAGGGTRTTNYNKADPQCGGFEGQACSVKDERGKETKFSYDANRLAPGRGWTFPIGTAPRQRYPPAATYQVGPASRRPPANAHGSIRPPDTITRPSGTSRAARY